MWEVVGVFKVGDSAANSEIWVDLDQLRGDFESSGRQQFASPARQLHRRGMADLKKTIEADQRLNAQTMKEKDYYATLTQGGLPLEILGFSVAVIMAVGSAFAATNTMYAAVSRRAKEVGTLRALGFSRGSILLSFMLESICLALLGGLLGLARVDLRSMVSPPPSATFIRSAKRRFSCGSLRSRWPSGWDSPP